MEKEKLIELSKQYFDNNKDLNKIYVSSDGQFFYIESYIDYHVARTKEKKFTITRADVYPKKVEKVDEKPKEPVKKVTKQNK